jgi:hypothetical protein
MKLGLKARTNLIHPPAWFARPCDLQHDRFTDLKMRTRTKRAQIDPLGRNILLNLTWREAQPTEDLGLNQQHSALVFSPRVPTAQESGTRHGHRFVHCSHRLPRANAQMHCRHSPGTFRSICVQRTVS